MTPEGNVSCAYSKTYCPLMDVIITSDVTKDVLGAVAVGEGLRSGSFCQQYGQLPHLSLDARSFADEQMSGSLIERWGRTPWPPPAPALTAFVVVFLGFVKDHFYPAPIIRSQVFLGVGFVPRTAAAVVAKVIHLVIDHMLRSAHAERT